MVLGAGVPLNVGRAEGPAGHGEKQLGRVSSKVRYSLSGPEKKKGELSSQHFFTYIR